jgi:hypothetical protein
MATHIAPIALIRNIASRGTGSNATIDRLHQPYGGGQDRSGNNVLPPPQHTLC